MMFKPLNKNVLIEKVHQNENVNGVLILPNNNTTIFKVLNIGKEVIEVKNGDKVLVDEYKLKKINYNTKEYYLINENDIYMIVEE